MRVVEENDFESETKDQNVIVQVSAEWCGPCKVLSPVLEAVANERNINTFKVNIDDCPNIVKKYSVRSVPRILFFKGGLLIEEAIGNQPKNKLETICDKIYK